MLLNFVRLGGLQFPMVEISWVGILLDINFLGGNFREWEFSRWKLSWVEVFRVGIVRVGVILGGNFPGGNCPDGSYPRWEFSLVGVIRVAIFLVGVFMLPQSIFKFKYCVFGAYENSILSAKKHVEKNTLMVNHFENLKNTYGLSNHGLTRISD